MTDKVTSLYGELVDRDKATCGWVLKTTGDVYALVDELDIMKDPTLRDRLVDIEKEREKRG